MSHDRYTVLVDGKTVLPPPLTEHEAKMQFALWCNFTRQPTSLHHGKTVILFHGTRILDTNLNQNESEPK